jgi:hypothetical protein
LKRSGLFYVKGFRFSYISVAPSTDNYIYQNTVIQVVLWAYWILVHNTTYMGVLMRIPYFGVSWARSFIYQNILILVVLMSILDFGTYIWACLWAYLIVVSHKHAQIYSKIRYKYWLCSWAYWILVHISACLWAYLILVSHEHAHLYTKIR